MFWALAARTSGVRLPSGGTQGTPYGVPFAFQDLCRGPFTIAGAVTAERPVDLEPCWQ